MNFKFKNKTPLTNPFPFVVAILFSTFGLAQTYNFKSYTVEDGLAQNHVLSIHQDKKGFMWFGTNNGGVSVFDGSSFKTITESEGLVNNFVYSIKEDTDGNLYMGTNGGLSVYNGTAFRNYTVETDSGLSHNRIFSVLVDRSGIVWLGTGQGVCQLINGKIEKFDGGDGLNAAPVFCMYEDSEGSIWYGTISKGVYRYEPSANKIKHISTSEGLDHTFVRTIIEDRSGLMWVGTLKGLCSINSNGIVKQERVNPEESTLTYTSSVIAPSGDVWFGTLAGLRNFSNHSFKSYTQQNGMLSNEIWTLYLDRENTLWISISNKGLMKMELQGNPFSNYGVTNGMPDEGVFSIYEDENNAMWFGSALGTYKMKADSFLIYKIPVKDQVTKYYGRDCYSITEDLDGKIWFATRLEDEAVWKYDDGKFYSYGKKDGFISNSVNFVFNTLSNNLWFGTSSGVIIKKGDSFVSIPELGKNKIWWISESSKGNYWLATENGVVNYDGKSVQYFTKKDGAVDGRVRTILYDKHKRFWMATNEGIMVYDTSFRFIDKSLGLATNAIYSLLLDGKENLWIGTNKGIYKLNIDAYNESGQVVLKHYGKEEGFFGVECYQNSVYQDHEGKIWFGTVKGVTIYDPTKDVENTIEPATHITGLRYEFNTYDWSSYSKGIDGNTKLPVSLELPYDKNHLTFDFIGISLSIPEKVRYRYILEPLEKDWGPPTAKHEAVYSYVPPGEYTFKVMACNNDGVWNKEPVSFSFTVHKPWYGTWWFYGVCVAVAGLSVLVFIKVREKQLRETQQMLETQVIERTSELREEKEKVEQINQEVLHQNEIIEEKNRDITDSINYAKRIQEAILPQESDKNKLLPESFVLFRPKDIVSGDFYWMAEKNGKVFFSAADCTGHGVPGAFMSMIGSALLNEVVNEKGVNLPSLILDGVKAGVIKSLKQGEFGDSKDGMDAVLCALTLSESKLEYAGANNPLYIVKKKGVKLRGENNIELDIELNLESDTHDLYEIKGDKQPIGYYTANDGLFTNNLFFLDKGDMVYLSSDGYPDQFGGPKGKKFMYKSFKKLLLELCELPIEKQKDKLNQTILEWMGSAYEQVDDVCVIGVRI